MTLIERYKTAQRELESCKDEYARSLQYALQAKRNRDEAESRWLIARHALAEERGIETVGQFEEFIKDPLGLQRKLEEK